MITVFTPLYNRANLIGNLYESLCRQTDKNFEWIVIDDGSKDNAKEKFDIWTKSDNGFDIQYHYVENGGKHRAVNKGVRFANGRMFFIVDSDDILPDNAIEIIHRVESGISDKSGYGGVAGIKQDLSYKNIGTTFDGEFIDATSLERDKLGISGDKAEVVYTNILEKYPFPEIDGENFITEDVVWNRIADAGYKLRWFNQAIYYAEYLEGGLTKSGREIFRKNPIGYTLAVEQNARLKKMSEKEKYHYYYYCYYDLKKDYSVFKVAEMLKASKWKLFIKVTEMNLKQFAHNILKREK